MTEEGKAEEYVRTLRVAGINSYNHCDVEKAYLDGLAEGRKEKQKIIDTQTVEIESRDVYLTEKENIIIRQQTKIQNLEKENAELKTKIFQVENICSQYVSNELAYKIKEIITNT